MKLKIVDHYTQNVAEGFGITVERYWELMEQIDNITEKPRLITIQQMLSEIAELCNTPEEFAVAIYMHTLWLKEHGRIIDKPTQPENW